MAFSYLILEDEAVFVRKFKNTIQSMDREGKIYATSDVKEALEIVKQVSIDIFLVDIAIENYINSLTGLDFIKEVRKIHRYTPIIVVSSSLETQQMIQSFNEFKIFAYIDKRFDSEQVEIELKKALEISELSNNRTISLKKKNDIKVYPTRNIFCIQRMPHGKKKVLVTSYDDTINEITTEEFSIRSSLGEILDLLDNDKDIIRVHQSWLINPKMIRGLSFLKEELTLVSDIKVPIGSTYREGLAPYI